MGNRALLMTVGTGTAEQEEETLFTPFRKSIESGEWQLVVLFPSQVTEPNARAIAERQKGRVPVEVWPLRQSGDEESVDACFTQFTEAIRELEARDFEAQGMTADYTRGTKAMSAALALAAVSEGVGVLRYVGATKRLPNGMAAPGHEKPSDIHPESIFRNRELQLGLDFLRHGDFAAAARLFPGGDRRRHAGPWESDIRWLQWCAGFWGAWDRFHYRTAEKQLGALPGEERAGWVDEFLPGEEQKALLAMLAGPEPGEQAKEERAAQCRAIAADLLANARRRFMQGQFEEVLVRVYRLLEIAAQERLFACGYNAEYMDAKDPGVAARMEQTSYRAQPDQNGRFKLGREKCAEFLQYLGESIATRLRDTNWLGGFNPVARNRSVLVHGYRSRTEGQDRLIGASLEAMEEFLRTELEDFGRLMEAARFRFLKE